MSRKKVLSESTLNVIDRRMSVMAYYTFKVWQVSQIAEMLGVDEVKIFQDLVKLRERGHMKGMEVTEEGKKIINNYDCQGEVYA